MNALGRAIIKIYAYFRREKNCPCPQFPRNKPRLGRDPVTGSQCTVSAQGMWGSRQETSPWTRTELFGAAAPSPAGRRPRGPHLAGTGAGAAAEDLTALSSNARSAAFLHHHLTFCSFANRKPSVPDSKLPALYASWTLSASSVSSQGSASESAQRQSRALKAALPLGHTALRRGRGCTRKSECGWALGYGRCSPTGGAPCLGCVQGCPRCCQRAAVGNCEPWLCKQHRELRWFWSSEERFGGCHRGP